MSTTTSNDDVQMECNRTPDIPINIISDLILAFVQDRRSWNSVCSANKELYEAGIRMTPPWPEAAILYLGPTNRTGSVKFSPCGSFLACGGSSPPFSLSICDRRGRLTHLTGHTSSISHLSFSNDGNYLASADNYKSIRIWPTNSTTGLSQQSDKTLLGHQNFIECLDFAPDDSNIFVSTQGLECGHGSMYTPSELQPLGCYIVSVHVLPPCPR